MKQSFTQYLFGEEYLFLSVNERVILGAIDSFSQKDGHCYASNETLYKYTGISVAQVTRTISSLKKKGIVEQTYFNGRTRHLVVREDRLIKLIRQTHQNDEADSSNRLANIKANNKELNIESNKEYKVSPSEGIEGGQAMNRTSEDEGFENYRDKVLPKQVTNFYLEHGLSRHQGQALLEAVTYFFYRYREYDPRHRQHPAYREETMHTCLENITYIFENFDCELSYEMLTQMIDRYFQIKKKTDRHLSCFCHVEMLRGLLGDSVEESALIWNQELVNA